MNGILVLNKPGGVTSRGVVDQVETWFPGVKVGHAGTLDPLATGVLVLCLGQATRLVEYVQRMPKTYAVSVRLGAWSNTDDADGTIEPLPDAPVPSRDQIRECLDEFVGEIEQVPPDYSAAQVEGRRAYALARKGRALALQPRPVHIHRIDLVRYEHPELDLVVECGKGTYVRSLARDLGRRLGCGGYVQRLQRTRIGPFTLTEAIALDADQETARACLLPLRLAVSELATIRLGEDGLRRLRQGQQVPHADLPQGEVALLTPAGELAGVASFDPRNQVLRPHKML